MWLDMCSASWLLLQGVGAAVAGWVAFNIGCWLAHAYLDREC